MDNNLVSAVATAIKNKRLELINQPLARIYNDLALAAISVLVKATEPNDCVAKEISIPAEPTADPAAKGSIKRYIINYDARGEQEHPSGDFVHYADHVAALRNLIEERDAERARAEAAEEALRESEAERDLLYALAAELKAEKQPTLSRFATLLRRARSKVNHADKWRRR